MGTRGFTPRGRRSPLIVEVLVFAGRDDQHLESASCDRTVRKWRAATGLERGRIELDDEAFALELDPHGELLAIGTGSSLLEVRRTDALDLARSARAALLHPSSLRRGRGQRRRRASDRPQR